MPSGLIRSKNNRLNEFKEYTYENICFYLTITWYAVSFKTKYLKSLGLYLHSLQPMPISENLSPPVKLRIYTYFLNSFGV